MSIKRENRNEINRSEWLKAQLLALPAGTSILDAGAGELRWKDTCSHLQYVSQDFCQYDGTGNSKGLNGGNWDTSKIDIVSDIIDIPVKDCSFDAILCTEVLEHLPSPELAIQEFARIVRPGGVLILTAPFCSLTHMAPYHFCTGFSCYWYETILKKYGFKIDCLESNGNYFSYMIQELSRISFVMKKYLNKKSIMIRLQSELLSMALKKYTQGNVSDELLCFGYHVKATKI